MRRWLPLPARRFSSGAAVCFLLAALFVFPATSVATCIDESPTQMYLDPDEVPTGEIGVDIPQVGLGPAPVVLFVPPLGALAVAALRIAPPVMVLAADDYIPGVDYTACLESTDGSGVITFLADGVYAVKTEYSDASVGYMLVQVGAKALGQCFRPGKMQEFTCPTPTVAFEGEDVATPPDFTNQINATSVMDLVNKVMTQAAGGPIPLVFVDHGCRGAFTVNGVDMVSLAPADAANLAKFCSLKGKVSSVTLLSCSTGNGTQGSDFLKSLSSCLGGVPVTGFTGDVSSWSRNGRRVWGSYGTAVTETGPVQNESSSWGRLKAIYR